MTFSEKWFTDRGLKTTAEYQYQQDHLRFISGYFSTNPKPLPLGVIIGTGGGKTFIGLAACADYLIKNPKAKIGWATEGNKGLRNQLESDIKKLEEEGMKLGIGFSYFFIKNKKDLSHPLAKKASVLIFIPQTVHRYEDNEPTILRMGDADTQTFKKKLPKLNLLVVDEVQGFYSAPMVQLLIKKTKPKHQLLFTATPQNLVRQNKSEKKFEFSVTDLQELLKFGVVQDPIINLVSTTYDFNLGNFNNEGDRINKKETDLTGTLDNLIERMLEKTSSALWRKDPQKYAEPWPVSKVLDDVKRVLGLTAMGKSLFIFGSIKEAQSVYKKIEKIGIKVVISTSVNDPESNELSRFIKDKNIKILIVVDRAGKGFNCPELETVADFTLSQNFSRLFQMIGRVIRLHPEKKQKLFIKVVPQNLAVYYRGVMECVLHLSDKRWLLEYTGNSKQIMKPVMKRHEERERIRRAKSPKTNTFKPLDLNGLFGDQPVFACFEDINHKDHDVLSPYATSTITKLDELISDTSSSNPNTIYTKDNCITKALGCISKDHFRLTRPTFYWVAKNDGFLGEISKICNWS